MSVAKRNFIRLSLSALAAVAVVCAIGAALHKNKKNNVQMPAVQPVDVIKPQPRDINITSAYIGQVEAVNRTEIVPFISGYVEDIPARGGGKVKKGDILATLKQDDYAAAVAAADAAVFAMKAEFLNAKIKYARMKESGEDVYSPQQIDDAKSAYLEAAGNLKKAEADKSSADTNFDYTYIKAPFDGVLGNIALSPGDYISPQSRGLMKLVQYDPVRVVFSVTGKDFLNRFGENNGVPLSVRAELSNGEILPQQGTIKYTANVIDKNTDSLAVYAEFANPDKKLIPGAYVKILLEREYKNVVLMPKPQVIMKSEGNYVYTVKSSVLNLHRLQILGETDDFIVVKNNFGSDEYPVADTVETVLTGEKVPYKIVKAEP